MHPGAPIEETPLISSQPVSLKESTVYVYLVASLSAIGGFLFGYDTGIISGAMIYVKDEFDLSEWWQEFIVSSTLLAAWIFSILSGSATDKFGRKPVIIFSSLVFVTGSIMMALAQNKMVLLAGRLVVGAGVGYASMTVPMYIAEVAPPGIRGRLVVINMCCVTGGQFCASILAYWFSYLTGQESWRYMLAFGAIPAAIQFFAFLPMPESPRWLVSNLRYAEAKRVLLKVRPASYDIEAEFEAIREVSVRAKEEESDRIQSGNEESMLSRILHNKPVRRALTVGCLLQVVQQVSGINTVMYYTASIFEMSGVYSKHEALLLSSATAFVNFTMTIVGSVLVERAGRRKLTLVSLFGVILGLATLGAGFQFAFVNSPPVTEHDNQTINSPCNLISQCSTCSRNSDCGFCYHQSPDTGAILSSTCLRVDESHHDRSLTGDCMTGSASAHIWAYEWCPSKYSMITLLGMVVYLFFFAFGMGPMPWTINSEIYPSWARSWCLSASTSVNWLFNLLISMTFLSLTRLITKHGAFYLYAGLSSIGFVYFVFVLPETRGKSLEQLVDLFADDKRPGRRSKEVMTDTGTVTGPPTHVKQV